MNTKWNENKTHKTIGNELPNNNTMSLDSIKLGDKFMAEKKSCCSETSWGTPFSSSYIHPLFMDAGKSSSSVALNGCALNSQVKLYLAKTLPLLCSQLTN